MAPLHKRNDQRYHFYTYVPLFADKLGRTHFLYASTWIKLFSNTLPVQYNHTPSENNVMVSNIYKIPFLTKLKYTLLYSTSTTAGKKCLNIHCR